jgi:hypothetical protein
MSVLAILPERPLTSAERMARLRARARHVLAPRRAAEWTADPDLRALVVDAIRAPELRIVQTVDGGLGEWHRLYDAWAGRGLRHPMTPGQLLLLAPFVVLPGAGNVAAAAMAPVLRRGTTYAIVAAVLEALTRHADQLGAWAAATLARIAGLRPSVARLLRGGSLSRSPSPVTDSLASSSGRPVDNPRVAWHPPDERPPGDPEPFGAVMARMGIAETFTDPSLRKRTRR